MDQVSAPQKQSSESPVAAMLFALALVVFLVSAFIGCSAAISDCELGAQLHSENLSGDEGWYEGCLSSKRSEQTSAVVGFVLTGCLITAGLVTGLRDRD